MAKNLKVQKKIFTARNVTLYLFLFPAVIYYAIFHYAPMYGALIAFQDYNPFRGMSESPWVGLKHFEAFFGGVYFVRLLRNTVLLSLYGLIFSFPMPIIFAILLNEVKSKKYRSTIQSLSYLPHFVSTVIICGLIVQFLAPNTGLIARVFESFAKSPVDLLDQAKWFRTIYIVSGIWQTMGWGSIIYFAALSTINLSLYEAADIDGAGRFQKIMHISLPGLLPTIITLLILDIGRILNVGFEKVMLLYRSSTYETADVISTYVYRSGLISQQYSFAAAVGLFNSLVGLILVLASNYSAKRIANQSLW
ncbi:MAG: ABC transporter permease subunit [Treponema sp.]|nr:ABC transporter permease subunit [Treponema sp.]